MGVYYQVYGLMKNKQKDLDWYLKHERYQNVKYINFEFEEYAGEIYDTLKSFASKTIGGKQPTLGEGGYVLSEEDIKQFIMHVDENTFKDKAEYYRLMAEVYDFHVGKTYERYLVVTIYD